MRGLREEAEASGGKTGGELHPDQDDRGADRDESDAALGGHKAILAAWRILPSKSPRTRWSAPHCQKTFEAELLTGGSDRHEGFKCPHCKLFVAYERADEQDRVEPLVKTPSARADRGDVGAEARAVRRVTPLRQLGIRAQVGAVHVLGGIVALSFLFRLVAGWLRATPAYFADEYIYAELGRSIAETGRPLIGGLPRTSRPSSIPSSPPRPGSSRTSRSPFGSCRRSARSPCRSRRCPCSSSAGAWRSRTAGRSRSRSSRSPSPTSSTRPGSSRSRSPIHSRSALSLREPLR